MACSISIHSCVPLSLAVSGKRDGGSVLDVGDAQVALYAQGCLYLNMRVEGTLLFYDVYEVRLQLSSLRSISHIALFFSAVCLHGQYLRSLGVLQDPNQNSYMQLKVCYNLYHDVVQAKSELHTYQDQSQSTSPD